MSRNRFSTIALFALATAVPLVGCHGTSPVFVRQMDARRPAPGKKARPARFVAFQQATKAGIETDQEKPTTPRADTLPPVTKDQAAMPSDPVQDPVRNRLPSDAERPQQPGFGNTPETAESGKPGAIPAYSVPALAYQQALLYAVSATSDGTEGFQGAGREASESLLVSNLGPAGRIGLTIPSSSLQGGIVSRPGLQRGLSSGLNFASGTNILRPRANPLSGPTGRCRELSNAGFFQGNRHQCERHFRR